MLGTLLLAAGAAVLLAVVGLLISLAVLYPQVTNGGSVVTRLRWIDSVGLNLTFRIDGFSWLFMVLVAGIGFLVILYARYYMSPEDPVARLYSSLLAFAGAMSGLILSGNIIMLVVFWELTSLVSFLLIGYWYHRQDARDGARMSLIVTATGGLCLLVAMILIGQIAGSYDLETVLKAGPQITSHRLYPVTLILFILGAFTKSAQFPFHFWLPNAMAAPTPVSAYLHSATMVKAGLFLMARLWPVLSGTPEWFYIVATTGLVTMVMAAWIGMFRDDLKSLLAFSTVSHLGLITMLLGFGTEAAAVAAVFHIINHATFKASLFMTAGIIDHEAGTRSIRRLGGLRRLMPITFVIGTVTALSMAGVAPLNGFLSKEMMLQESSQMVWAGHPALIVTMAAIGAVFSVCYSLRFIWQVFFGPERDDYPHHPHDPGFGMWGSPALLAVLVVLIGLFSNTMVGWLVAASASAVTGVAQHPHFALWHGLTLPLMLSVTALLGGMVLLALNHRMIAIRDMVWRPDGKRAFDAITRACTCAAMALTQRLTNGSMSRALAALTLTIVLCGLWAFSTGGYQGATRPMLEIRAVPLIGWALLIVATGCMVYFHRLRIMALVLVGIIGLIVSCSFLYLSAPDLALTQISVEVVTVILLLLALNFLPKFTVLDSRDRKRGVDAFIATVAGLGFGTLSYIIMRSDFAFPSISGYMVENSHKLGGGDNVVNVILVDFRGYDTFGEITVLGIAALTIFALTETLLTGTSSRRLRNWVHDSLRAGDRHPLMLVVVTRLILPITLVVGLYIFLRGHNTPGGGFIAGLVVAIALVSQYMASGYAWAQERQKIQYHALIGAGVMAAGITGIGAWFGALPFLTSTYGYVKLPGLEKFELASAMGFDLGVFLCVVGAVMLMLNSLSRIARHAGETVNLHPMDIDPSKEAPRP